MEQIPQVLLLPISEGRTSSHESLASSLQPLPANWKPDTFQPSPAALGTSSSSTQPAPGMRQQPHHHLVTLSLRTLPGASDKIAVKPAPPMGTQGLPAAEVHSAALTCGSVFTVSIKASGKVVIMLVYL